MNIYGKAWCPLKIINTVAKVTGGLCRGWDYLCFTEIKVFLQPISWASYYPIIREANKLYKNLNLTWRDYK